MKTVIFCSITIVSIIAGRALGAHGYHDPALAFGVVAVFTGVITLVTIASSDWPFGESR